jgi:hypothetical protein
MTVWDRIWATLLAHGGDIASLDGPEDRALAEKKRRAADRRDDEEEREGTNR